jgi:hypothetical protein
MNGRRHRIDGVSHSPGSTMGAGHPCIATGSHA